LWVHRVLLGSVGILNALSFVIKPGLFTKAQRVPEPKTLKNRLHLDIRVDDIEQATAQIETLGGRRLPVEDFREHGFRWRVMADPEGNGFCLVYGVFR
jgi:predicted enzyme related to lactoylglutathione lyase